MNVNWNYPTAIRNGAGRVSELADCCRELAITTPLLVTDPGLARLPMIADAISLCQDSGLDITLFSAIKSNPNGENIEQGITQFNRGQHDGVLAFGGGSALDAAKTIAVLARQNGSIWELEDIGDNWKNVDSEKIAPVIALPTTAGTGSEVGRAAVITNTEEQRKVILFHPQMLPLCVILDPELSRGLPPALTAATGMDALSHNLEAYCAPSYHPLAVGIAVEGIRLIRDYLPQAVADGANLASRNQMLVASMMGATAFQRGLGAMHALAHPLGAIFDAHHGMLNAVLMPYVLQANRSAITERIERLTRYLGISADFNSFLDWILQLRRQIEIPNNLAALGINDSCIDTIGQLAIADPTAASNPISFTAAEYQDIFKAALSGEL